MVRVLESKSPVPGLILGPGPPHSMVCRSHCNTVQIKYKILGLDGL